MNLYVCNFPFHLTESELEDAFSEVGKVQSVKIITDHATGNSKGYGFVLMKNEEEARRAIAIMHGRNLGGRTITVDLAYDSKRR